MGISLDNFLQEIESLSPGFLIKIENLYPLHFNVGVDSVSKFSITLNHDAKSINFSGTYKSTLFPKTKHFHSIKCIK